MNSLIKNKNRSMSLWVVFPLSASGDFFKKKLFTAIQKKDR